MATLTSIKNKYLQYSDGTVLGVTINTENVSALSLKLATADSLSQFNLIDGFADDYNDATGVDASASTNEIRDSSSKYYGSTLEGSASGGTETTYTGYKVHSFLTSANFVVDGAANVDVLVVGGGGGGASGGTDYGGGGGGGAGGFRTSASHAVTAQTYAVTVGGGGAAGSGNYVNGGQGNNSVFDTITSAGGGYGGAGQISSAVPGAAGGSGGGGGGRQNTGGPATGGAGNTPSTSPAQGFAGADGMVGSGFFGGGGGGASEVGETGSTSVGGDGGDGLQNLYRTGSNVYYGGGGGSGGGSQGPKSAGGQGGGAAGARTGAGPVPAPGTANSGGGGGGGTEQYEYGSAGGSGIVVIRYATDNNMTLISNGYTAQSAPTTARIIMDEYTSTGSATLNTDIKAYASRDSGTTYTQITLADQGTIETNHRLLSGSVDISGQPSGVAVKYKIETLNQSSSKITRVYGTSMAWA